MRVALLGGLFISLLLGGCATAPDGKPFADATGVWAATVKTSGQAVADSLRSAPGGSAAEAASSQKLADEFGAAWAVRVRAVDGVVLYSDALVDLVAASADTDATVKKVGDAVQGLAVAANIPLAGTAVEAGSDIARFLLAQIANVRAAKQLEQSILAAQPAVEQIAGQIEKDGKHLIGLIDAAYKNQVSVINEGYSEDAKLARALQRKQLELGGLLTSSAGAVDPLKLSQMQEMDKIRASALARLAEREQKLGQAAIAHKAQLQMISGLSTATSAWLAAHRDLANAVQQKRKINVTQLQETIGELKELIKKVRAL